MKRLVKFSFLFLTITLAACQKEPVVEPSLDDIEIVDGWIVAPDWLAAEVRRLTDTTGDPYIYPKVYVFEYEGEDYISIWNPLEPEPVYAHKFYTVSGKIIDHRLVTQNISDAVDFQHALHIARKQNGILIWSHEDATQSRSAGTRAASNPTIRTPKGTSLPAAAVNFPVDGALNSTQSSLVSAWLSEHPNATILSPPTLTYNCHGYAWHMTGSYGSGQPVWLGSQQYPDPAMFYTDGFNGDGSYVQIPYPIAGRRSDSSTQTIPPSWRLFPPLSNRSGALAPL